MTSDMKFAGWMAGIAFCVGFGMAALMFNFSHMGTWAEGYAAGAKSLREFKDMGACEWAEKACRVPSGFQAEKE